MALDNDPVLHDHRIVLEIDRVNNRNKNPVAERAGLELQLLRQEPQVGQSLMLYSLSPPQP